MEKKVTTSALASLAGCSKSAVSKAAKEKRLPKGSDGLFDLMNPSVQVWITDSARKRGASGQALREALEAETRPQEYKPIKYDSTLHVFGDFQDGQGFRQIIQYNFDPACNEQGHIIFPVPEAVHVEWNVIDGEDCSLFTLSGRKIPCRIESREGGLEAQRRYY